MNGDFKHCPDDDCCRKVLISTWASSTLMAPNAVTLETSLSLFMGCQSSYSWHQKVALISVMRTAVEPSDCGKCTKSLDTLCGGFKTPLPQLTGNRGASASPRHVRKYSAQRLQASSQDSLTQNLDLKAEITFKFDSDLHKINCEFSKGLYFTPPPPPGNARQAWGGEKKDFDKRKQVG